MDEIQRVLIKQGRKDLAQKYYEKISERNNKTFKCPDCGCKVLDNTSYCVKCQEKKENPNGKQAAALNTRFLKVIRKLNSDIDDIRKDIGADLGINSKSYRNVVKILENLDKAEKGIKDIE